MMKVGTTKRIVLVLIIMIGMLGITISGVYADDQCSIIVSPNIAGLEITRGGREQLDLSGVFSDSQGHELSYTLDESEESLKARIKDGILLIDPLEIGEFEIKLTAECDVSKEEKQITIPVNVVESEDEGNPAQYGYDETPAEYVTPVFTISSDGVPLMGNDADNTILSHLKVTVPYFDLALYGLEDFYRYHTKNGRGNYIDDEVIERPTAMHLMIYVTERYYMGIPEDECCKGTSGILEFKTPLTMRNMYGEVAYKSKYSAYSITGDATSSYMKNLWGHDENLMYYRNHFFPLMSPGWGSTSDYQLLSDGDTFDVAMYTDWNFYNAGAFCSFDQDEYETKAGEMLLFSTMKTSSSEFGSGELKPISGLKAEIYDEDWNNIATIESDTAGFGYAFQQPGTYHIIGLDANAGTSRANKAPATADVTVTDPFVSFPFTRIFDQYGKVIPRVEKEDDIPGIDHYHVSVPSGTTQANIEWPDLPDDLTLYYWDYASQQAVQTGDTAVQNEDVVTILPELWNRDGKALVLADGEGNPIAAFTFGFYNPEGINFAPSLKPGIKPVTKLSWREKKDYTINMSDIFIDNDGDDMTYTASVDGADPEVTGDTFTYRSDQLGDHTIVITPADVKGKEGETYTLDLRITANQKPELKDPSDSSKEVTIRYDENVKINLINVFDDFDSDHIVYLISKDGGDYEASDIEEITEYGDYIGPVQREHWQARNFIYKPSGTEDMGEHVFRIKAKDDMGESDDVYTLTVTVADDRAPVPEQTEYTEYSMLNHYWICDYRSRFTDPEGDMMRYTYRVNDGPEMECGRDRTGDKWNIQRLLLSKNEKYTITFYATDSYSKTGSFVVNLYPTEEVIHNSQIEGNFFSGSESGNTVYDVHNGYPATWINGFKVSDNVTLRDVRYSEQDGHFNYYIDVDSMGIGSDDTFDITLRSEPSEEGLYVGPSFGITYYNENHITLKAEDGVTEGVLKWNNQSEKYPDYLQIIEHWRWYRIFVNIVESDAEPEELVIEPQKEGLYTGEYTDRTKVKARYSDGVVRNVKDYTLDRESFDKAGTQKLGASALGLTCDKDVTVMEVPSYMAILNDKGLHGRLRLMKVTDETGDPIENAIVTVGEPELNPDFSYATYDDYVDSMRQRYDVEVRLPMTVSGDSDIKIEFEMLRDNDYAIEFIKDAENISTEKDDLIRGILTVSLEHGKGQVAARWIDRMNQYVNGAHAYDQFDISIKTGACEVIGKVSSWDDKDNAEFLVYPSDMSDEEIRADATGSKEHALETSVEVQDAVKNANRHERTFKVERIDPANYKLAVIKPGKYVAPVVPFEVDGTADVGTIALRLYGDINNDGLLDVRDVTQIARFGVGKRQFTEEENLAADVNMDKTVDVRDITQLCRKIVGKSSSLDNIN